VQQLIPLRSQMLKKPHRPDVHQRHFLEIQSRAGLRGFDVCVNLC
jgi:hypothetical protein